MADYKTTVTKTPEGTRITSGNMTDEQVELMRSERERSNELPEAERPQAAFDSMDTEIAARNRFKEMREILAAGGHKEYTDEQKEAFLTEYKKIKASYSLAEGGAVPMKEQMSMFEDGGLMDEGGSIDPISGNDVPPGSTQEEVRDDIPAQLSEGEFVFPADVVRFIGLSNLMQMRQQAKMGLKTMEDMGQMGNSDEATMPDNLPFDINDLDVEDDGVVQFADGGLAGNNTNTGVFFNPAAGATTGVAAAPIEAASQQFVEPVRPAQADVPTMKSYSAAEVPKFQGFVGENIPGVDFEYVEYTNEAGNIIKIRKSKSTGELLDPVPEGYTFVDPASTTTPTVSPTAQVKPTVPYDEGQGSKDEAADDGLPAGITSTNAKAAALKALDPKFGNVIKGINDKYSSKVTNINPLVPGGLIRAAINGYKKMSETKKAINDYDYTTLETPTAQEIADGKGNSLTADEMKSVVDIIGNEIYSGYRDAEGNITAESVAKGPKSSDGLVQQMKDSFSTGKTFEEGDTDLNPDNVPTTVKNVTETAITDIAKQNQSDIAKASNPTVATTQSIGDKAGKSVSDITNQKQSDIAEIVSSAAEQVTTNRETKEAVEIILNNYTTTDEDGVNKTTITEKDALNMVNQFGAKNLIADDKAVKEAANDRAVKATQDRYFQQQGGKSNVTQPSLAASGLEGSDPGGGQSDENPNDTSDNQSGSGGGMGGSFGSVSDNFGGGDYKGAFVGEAYKRNKGLASKPKPKKTKKMKKGGLASKK